MAGKGGGGKGGDKGGEEEKMVDVFRETNLRYMGYANELGEALRPFIGGKLVTASYGLSSSYVAADSGSKFAAMYQKLNKEPLSQVRESIKTGLDVLIWQTLASIGLPGLCINRTVALTRFLVCRSIFHRQGKIITSIVGVTTIPFIVAPIDKMVDHIMDEYVRPIIKKI